MTDPVHPHTTAVDAMMGAASDYAKAQKMDAATMGKALIIAGASLLALDRDPLAVWVTVRRLIGRFFSDRGGRHAPTS
jgi:hypothetical protein